MNMKEKLEKNSGVIAVWVTPGLTAVHKQELEVFTNHDRDMVQQCSLRDKKVIMYS